MIEKEHDLGSISVQDLQRENLMLRARVNSQEETIHSLEETVDGYLRQILDQKCQILRAQIKDKEDQLAKLEEQLNGMNTQCHQVRVPKRTSQAQEDEITRIINGLSDLGKEETLGAVDMGRDSIRTEQVAQGPDELSRPHRNEEPVSADEPAAPPVKKKSLFLRILGMAGNVAFYVALVSLLVGAFFIRSAQGGAPLNIAGYSGMLVLSGSMQDVIPKGSFLLTKSVEADTLAVGDDITFMTNSTTSVTHRIIEIMPQPDGTLEFRTQGVNNTAPDNNPVSEVNIVGKVIYHNYRIGMIAQWVSDNWPFLVFLLAVWIVLGFVLRWLNSDKEENVKAVDKPSRQDKRGLFGKAAKRGQKNEEKTDDQTLVGAGR